MIFAQLPAQLYVLQITLSVPEELMLLVVKCLKHACHKFLDMIKLYVQFPVLSLVLQITCGVTEELMLLDV